MTHSGSVQLEVLFASRAATKLTLFCENFLPRDSFLPSRTCPMNMSLRVPYCMNSTSSVDRTPGMRHSLDCAICWICRRITFSNSTCQRERKNRGEEGGKEGGKGGGGGREGGREGGEGGREGDIQIVCVSHSRECDSRVMTSRCRTYAGGLRVGHEYGKGLKTRWSLRLSIVLVISTHSPAGGFARSVAVRCVPWRQVCHRDD
jgi:hypothetical protein